MEPPEKRRMKGSMMMEPYTTTKFTSLKDKEFVARHDESGFIVAVGPEREMMQLSSLLNSHAFFAVGEAFACAEAKRLRKTEAIAKRLRKTEACAHT
jgi:hypothetical protein